MMYSILSIEAGGHLQDISDIVPYSDAPIVYNLLLLLLLEILCPLYKVYRE